MTSIFVLAVDIGTSRTAASIATVDTEGTVETARFALGRQADSAPTAVFVSDDDLLFGDAAERRGLAQPERLIREFKRRIGDDVPVVVNGRRFASEDLFARMVAWVTDAVAEREGRQPDAIVATVPVTWGHYRRSLVTAALERDVSCPVHLVSEPVAAAWHYTTSAPVPDDKVLAVYDLGGGTFDVALVETAADATLRIISAPTGLADFGGADFDDQVMRHTIAAAGLSAADLAADPASRVALAALRRECVQAKEALSFDSEAAVPVFLGGTSTTVRITRAEFEDLIEPGIERTISLLQSALETSDIGGRLEAVLLTGGSSRIPRVAQLLSERIDAPIAVDADPKAVVSLGAARILADGLARGAAFGTMPSAAASALAASVVARADAVPDGIPDISPAARAAAYADDGSAASAPMTRAERAATRRRWFRLPTTVAVTGSIVLAGGIVLASATGLGNATRSPAGDESSFGAWLGLALSDEPAAAAETDAADTGEPPSSTPAPPSGGTSPRSTAPNSGKRVGEREAAAPEAKDAATRPATGSGTDAAGKGSSGTKPEKTPSGSSDGTVEDPSEDSTTDPGSEPTGPEPDPEPATGTPPEPEPTTDPVPEPTTDPAPEPTTDPAPEPTTDPAPDPPPPSEPDPASDPPVTEPEQPAPEPEPSPTATTIPEPE